MITYCLLDRKTAGGRYCDIIDVAEWLAAGDYASATNAIACMCRESPLYKAAAQELRQIKAETDAAIASSVD